MLPKSLAQGWSYKNGIAFKLEYDPAQQGFSLKEALGEIRGDWPKMRDGPVFVLDVRERVKEGTRARPKGLGWYFKDIDVKGSLPAALSDAIHQMHTRLSDIDDLLRFHPEILGVTGNRVRDMLWRLLVCMRTSVV